MKVFFDGGCRPNPGPVEIAVVAAGRGHIRRDLGRGTNGDAEWLALIEALRIARPFGDFVLLGDALAVIAVVNGIARPRGAAIGHLAAFHELAGDTTPRLRHVGRAQNLAGIALARLHPR